MCWLPGTLTEPLNGVPLCPNPETASTAVGETAISATDLDITTQLEGSEETRKHKHKTFPRNVNRDRHDARQDAHQQIKSRSGKSVEHAHRPQAGTLGAETKMGGDHLFLVRRAIPQHVKAVLNHSESGAVSSAMSDDGVGCGLVVALEAIKPLGRTRLIKRDAVKNPVCNTPNASSVSAGGVERVTYEVEKRIRTLRSSKGYLWIWITKCCQSWCGIVRCR